MMFAINAITRVRIILMAITLAEKSKATKAAEMAPKAIIKPLPL
jgi:hypothetical protein